jgi:hypothetical protein
MKEIIECHQKLLLQLVKGRGLEWPSTHQCTIQKIPFWDFMDGMKVSPSGQFTWSVFYFSSALFFPT